jgi:hypothetical protein
MSHGMEAYGLYWHCLELIASNVTADNLTFELEHDSELIAYQTGHSRDRVEAIMRDMVQMGLFESSHGKITCLKMMSRIDQSQSGNPKFRKAINDAKTKHDSVMTQSGDSHDSVMLESAQKIEDRTEDRTDAPKVAQKRRRFTPPTLEQVTDYCRERGNAVDPQKFLDHYEANGWVRGKTKIKDWRACVRTWECKTPARQANGGEPAI